VVSWLTSPATAAICYAVAVVGVHRTGLMDTAMRDSAAHVTEELAYLGAGFLLFQLVFGVTPGRWQLSGAGKLGLLAVVAPVDTVVGFVLLQTGTVSAGAESGGAHAAHGGMVRPDWALSPDADTVAAGTTMWIGGTGIMALLMITVALVWLHGGAPVRSRPSWTDQARRATFAQHTGSDRPGEEVDSDEEALRAYNTWLARLADPDRDRAADSERSRDTGFALDRLTAPYACPER
jgi:cytochrome c oxidase assembly factor CtaG